MRAAIVTAYGQPPELSDWPDPTPRHGQTLIRNRAAALNPVDLKMATGTYYFGAPQPPYVAGAEGVGYALTGASVEEGTRVWYETGPRGGAFAGLTAVDDTHLIEIPDGIDDTVAATLGVAGLAAWDALTRRAALCPGETVLVLGASGAVGAVAVQAARLLGAAWVVAAARNTAMLSPTVRAAADAVVTLGGTDVDILTARLHAAAPDGYDVILDPLWGRPAQAALACAAEGARLVQLGSSASETLSIPAGTLRKSSTSILGYTIYAMPWTAKREAYHQLAQHAETLTTRTRAPTRIQEQAARSPTRRRQERHQPIQHSQDRLKIKLRVRRSASEIGMPPRASSSAAVWSVCDRRSGMTVCALLTGPDLSPVKTPRCSLHWRPEPTSDSRVCHRNGLVWISPLSRTYRTQPPPITNDLPEPRPRPACPDYPSMAIPDDDWPILERPPPQPDPPPPTWPPDPDEPPPF